MIKHCIYISKLEGSREVKPFTIFDKNSFLLDINTFGFMQTEIIFENLKKVLKGEFINGYEWSGPRISFESNLDKTIGIDSIFDYECKEFKTAYLFEIFGARLEFLRNLSAKEILISIEQSYKLIKADPFKFKAIENRYQVLFNDVLIDFVLLPADFLLSVESILSKIFINKKYLNSEN